MTNIEAARDVVTAKTARQVKRPDGSKVLLDLFTASHIVKVHDALNDENQVMFENMSIERMASLVFKLVK